jgi:hypothetical protein
MFVWVLLRLSVILKTVEVWSKVLDGRHTDRACCVERSVRRQDCHDHISTFPCDTIRALISQSDISQREGYIKITGSQENNLPFRRYEGVTLVTVCVSVCMSAAIGKREFKGPDLVPYAK